ncbi:hypothetical protein RhiJN_26407 [Ceratobasidium sp. AG-Ba]|nr:hypothetical protein RhiJN_26407 [Ceratobasidium sp. AG-Ba]
MRPTTKRKAAAMLRAEGYTPEEVAARLIPGYVAITQPSTAPTDDPPRQVPESSSLTQAQLQLEITPENVTQQPTVEQPIATTAIQSPPLTPPIKQPEQGTDDDGDILMPSSSPPPASPIPTPSPERPTANDMSVDEIEHEIANPTTDFLVPVSSPPPAASARASSVGARTPRLKRRSSFSQLSSSPPDDEFTAPRYEPLPASPSTAKMIEERERELKEKGTERERDKQPMQEKQHDKVQQVIHRGRGSPPAGQKPRLQPSEIMHATVSSGRGAKPKRGLVRGWGQPGFQISTPGRHHLPVTAPRRVSPGLRIESRTNPSELRSSKPPQATRPQTPPRTTESTVDSTPTAEQMISRYTHAGSDDDEDILDDLKAGLDDPDLGLQTQVPYISQPETQTSGVSQTRE